MRLTRQKKIIVGALALILSLMVGYAILSESLSIKGTASTGSSDFNIIFSAVNNISEKGSSNASANIIDDGKKLQVTVPNLQYPTAYAEVDVTIKNEGELNAILTGIETQGLDNTDIKVSYSGITQDEVLGAGQEKRMKIKVLWDEASTSNSANASFTITITYEQDTEGRPTATNTTLPQKTYAVGDEFCLGEECFYTIKDNGDTVTALSKYNLLVGNVSDGKSAEVLSVIESTTPGYGLQNSSAKGALLDDYNFIGTIDFSQIIYWFDDPSDPNGDLKPEYGEDYPAYVYDSNSLLYEYVKNYESYLKDTLGKTSVEARLITYDELIGLGCSRTCESAPSWVYNTSYWSGSADYNNIFYVTSYAGLGITMDNNFMFGVRPVITISKSDI